MSVAVKLQVTECGGNPSLHLLCLAGGMDAQAKASKPPGLSLMLPDAALDQLQGTRGQEAVSSLAITYSSPNSQPRSI